MKTLIFLSALLIGFALGVVADDNYQSRQIDPIVPTAIVYISHCKQPELYLIVMSDGSGYAFNIQDMFHHPALRSMLNKLLDQFPLLMLDREAGCTWEPS